VVDAAATFNAPSQSFAIWNVSGPSFLNTLTHLRPGSGLWILVRAATRWQQPVVSDPGAVELATGFNLLTWTGPSGLDPDSALGLLGDDLLVAFAFDPAVATFTSYGPTRPAFVNDLEPMTYGDGFWALMDGARAWQQPPAPAPFTRALAGGDVTLTIPRGALPPGIDPDTVQISDITESPAFAALGEEAEGVLVGIDLRPAGAVFAVPVVLTVTVPNSAGANLFALLSSGDEIEFVSDISVLDARADSVTIAAGLSHFSSYWIVGGPSLVTAANQDVGPIGVGTRFDAETEVTVKADFNGVVTGYRDNLVEALIQTRDRRIVVDRDRSWFLFGANDSFRPLEGAVARVGPERQIPGPFTPTPPFVPITVRQNFSCDGPGDFVILFLQQASVPVEGGGTVNIPDVDAFVRGTCTALPASVSFFVFQGSDGGARRSPRFPCRQIRTRRLSC